MTTNPPTVETSKPLSTKDLLNSHGTGGRLILTLRRYAALGWLAFFVLLLLFIALIFVSTLAPKPIIAVDASGRVLGNIEYLSASSRSSQEVIATAKYFAQNYLSLNSETIFDDYSQAMNMMGDALLKEATVRVSEQYYLARIRDAQSRSYARFNEPDGAQLLAQKNLTYDVRLQGSLVVTVGKTPREQPFNLTLRMTAIPRTAISTQGFRVDEVIEN